SSKHAALKKATELSGEETNAKDVMGIASKGAAKGKAEDFAGLFARQIASLPRSPKALDYLKGRGLNPEMEIGYNSGQYWNKLKQCITFPLKDQAGNITSLYGRRITESSGHNIEYGRHYYSENRKGLYPGYPPQDTQTLIITEAIIDAATLLQIQRTDKACLVSITILSAYGTNGLTTEHKAAIKALKNLSEIIFFFDGDQPGQEGAARYAHELYESADNACVVSIVPTPQDEDINSLWLNYGKEAILQLIEERQPCEMLATQITQGKPINKSFSSIEDFSIEEKICHPSKVLQTARAQSPLNTEQPNKITYTTQTARYIVKGSLPKTFDRMTISLDVQHLETAIKYRTRLDLYEEKQVRKEAREAAEKLELRSDLIENDLSQLTDLLEEYRENQLQQSTKDADSDITLTLAEQARCKAFLQQADLIQKLNQFIGQSGITGEDNNRLFLFVIATSHKMPDTLHALIQGSSGSGKTHLLSKIAELMPDERVVKFTRVTENSFYNYDEYFFRGKLICLEDIDGLKEEALFAWRELISNNQLSSSTSQKDENGNIRSAQRIVRGPMASICATTHGQIYEDNMSRLFIIAVDESSEQTARIMNYQKQKAAGLIDAEKEREASALLQNLVRMLKPCKVINPFAYQIHLPEKAHKIRRLNELYLAFVKQVTIINQYRRKKDAQGRIVTDTEDLKTANEIMFDSIFLKVDELDGSLRQFYEELKHHIKTKSNPEQYEFMQREIRHALNISKSQLQRYISDLIELEYIQQMGGYQNRGYKYKILWWDDIAKLREDVKQHLKNQIDKLKNESRQ
ncbi:toprim domain-containing protein, partial [Alkaliflexus imshenetskii]|uniref:toprim domain-containing protein n=1 Tax=Alkaliflexus imshenetskii TaxID=286730 RepID=UPI000693857D